MPGAACCLETTRNERRLVETTHATKPKTPPDCLSLSAFETRRPIHRRSLARCSEAFPGTALRQLAGEPQRGPLHKAPPGMCRRGGQIGVRARHNKSPTVGSPVRGTHPEYRKPPSDPGGQIAKLEMGPRQKFRNWGLVGMQRTSLIILQHQTFTSLRKPLKTNHNRVTYCIDFRDFVVCKELNT